MQITKTFVTPDNKATITCPKCNKSRNVEAIKYRNRKHTIKVRCSCHCQFAVLLDYRVQYRKETNLDGSYIMVPPAVGKGKLSVLNISRSGIGFTVGFSVSGSHSLHPGQKVRVFFQLDNKKRTDIEKVVTIKNVDTHYIGGKFDEIQAFEKDLGFYLRP